MHRFLFRLTRTVARPLWGDGIGARLPFVGKMYSLAFRRLAARDTILTEIHGLKIDADSRTSIAETLTVAGSYEEQTTRLVREVLKEGMTVLDLGANVGYYTLLAARQVGETGRVFAFEPWHESFSLLQRNVKANGFNNIVPVAKAVSNRCGKQRLFLDNDPASRSLEEEDAGKNWVETEVTTVDEFVRERNISVDLIKMDVEGSEMKVLEAMTETIRANKSLKIIV
jgi:FkbM family methyltransferase